MRKTWCIGLIVALIVLDVISKQWVSHALLLSEVWPIFPGLNITLAHNTGAAFSFLAEQTGWQRMFLAGVAIVVSLIFSVWLARTPVAHRWTSLGLSCVIGGAVGNVIDRLYYGYVIDFIDVYVGIYHWPAFNVADSAICVGAALLIVGMFRGEA